MNLVSLLLLPAVISLRNNTAERLLIAGVCLVILVIAIGFSKRSTGSMAGELEGATLTFDETGDDNAPSGLVHADVATGALGLNRPNGDVVVAIDVVIENVGDDTVLIERLRARRAQFDEP
jgi:hypothetical protein